MEWRAIEFRDLKADESKLFDFTGYPTWESYFIFLNISFH